MDVPFFIARRLRYKGRVVTAAVAVSFLVVIIAVSVSAGFRREISDGISHMAGDVLLAGPGANYLDEKSSVSSDQPYLDEIKSLRGVRSISPVIYRAGIVRHDEQIYGVMVKGVEGGVHHAAGEDIGDSVSLAVSIPSTMSEIAGIKAGDKMLTYFIAEKVKLRQFNVVDVYEPQVRLDDRFVVYADISDLRRLNQWDDDDVSAFEVVLSEDMHGREDILAMESRIQEVLDSDRYWDGDWLWASSSVRRYPQIFDWFGIIDFNSVFVLVLMIAVAGVNMITGLLIMLFENISTIGLLKSLGMRNRAIVRVFLTNSMNLVFKGMVIGNVLAFVFCLVQDQTHMISLDPVNYFVSYVPVYMDPCTIIVADVVAFASIMLLLLIPSLFVLRVDPAKTIKMD